jgi:hypothetical protein
MFLEPFFLSKMILVIFRKNPTIWYNLTIYKWKRSLLYRIKDYEFEEVVLVDGRIKPSCNRLFSKSLQLNG